VGRAVEVARLVQLGVLVVHLLKQAVQVIRVMVMLVESEIHPQGRNEMEVVAVVRELLEKLEMLLVEVMAEQARI